MKEVKSIDKKLEELNKEIRKSDAQLFVTIATICTFSYLLGYITGQSCHIDSVIDITFKWKHFIFIIIAFIGGYCFTRLRTNPYKDKEFDEEEVDELADIIIESIKDKCKDTDLPDGVKIDTLIPDIFKQIFDEIRNERKKGNQKTDL